MTHFLLLNTKGGTLKNGQTFYHLIYRMDYYYAVFGPCALFLLGEKTAQTSLFFFKLKKVSHGFAMT